MSEINKAGCKVSNTLKQGKLGTFGSSENVVKIGKWNQVQQLRFYEYRLLHFYEYLYHLGKGLWISIFACQLKYTNKILKIT